jgi:hypothetical protein
MNKVADYSRFSDPSFYSDSDVVPFAQWFNPQKGIIGLGIRKDQAEIANFTPDKRWELKSVEFDTKKEEFYVSVNPRIIVLNATSKTRELSNCNPIYMVNETTGETSLFKKEAYTSEYKAFSYLVFCVVSEDGKLISEPIRLKTKSKSHMTLWNHYKSGEDSFSNQLLAYLKTQGVSIPPGKIPVCELFAFSIFEPKMEKGKVSSAMDGKSSPACLVTGFNPVTDKTMINDPESSEKILAYIKNLKKYITVRSNDEPEIEVTEEVQYDPETGEVINPEITIQSLEGLPF